jgi:hypothetical protein
MLQLRASPKCKDNSFWAGATASKDGTINFKSNLGVWEFFCSAVGLSQEKWMFFK